MRPEPGRYRRGVASRQRHRVVAAGLGCRRPPQKSRAGEFCDCVSDSREERWTITAAIDESIPAPVLSAALYQRFSRRGDYDFADKVLSTLRFEFGGHEEKGDAKNGDAA